jgi:hypothetical protein
MGLVRFGGSAFDLADVMRIYDETNIPDNASTSMIVTFRDGSKATFHGPDAQALRTLVKGLPDGSPMSSTLAEPGRTPQPGRESD